MHYQFTVAQTPTCVQTGSNYSDAGLTDCDKLTLHILYPEDSLTAEYVGTTVVRAGRTLGEAPFSRPRPPRPPDWHWSV